MNVQYLGVLVDQTAVKQLLFSLQLTNLVHEQVLLTLVRIYNNTKQAYTVSGIG